jgi:hypothetical protein
MNIYVLSSSNYVKLLPEFAERFQKFWGAPFTTYVSNTDIDHWSDGVIDFLLNIKDEHFVLLHEDFYLDSPVDKHLIQELWDIRDGYDRISLLGNHTPTRTERWNKYFVHRPGSEYQFSFEASIQNRDFLLGNLHRGRTPWETERKARLAEGKVLSSEYPAIWYTDKSRQLEIQCESNT